MKRNGGFTLIELLVVVAIVGILAAVAIPKLMSAIDKAKEGVIKSDIAAINSALQMYSIDNPSNNMPSQSSKTVLKDAFEDGDVIPTYLGKGPKAPWQPNNGTAYAYEYECQPNSRDYTITAYANKGDGPYTIYYYAHTNEFSNVPNGNDK